MIKNIKAGIEKMRSGNLAVSNKKADIQNNRTKYFWWILILLGLFIVTFRIWVWGSDLENKIKVEKAIVARLTEVKNNGLDGINPEEFTRLSKTSLDNLYDIDQSLSPFYPTIRIISRLPFVDPVVSQIEPGLKYGMACSKLANSLGQAALPFWLIMESGDNEPVDNNNLADPGKKIYQAYIEAKPYIDQTTTNIDEVTKARNELDLNSLPIEYQGKFKEIDELMPKLELVMQYQSLLPKILGGEEPQNYLIMVQNRDELRPTGGFITSFGLVRIDRGVLVMMDFEDSTHLDHVDQVLIPPEPIHQIMLANYWVPRDGNWSPDFPTAAKQVQDLYFSSTGYPTNGVLAFDQGFLVNLMKFLGPISLSDGQTISADNIEPIMVKKKMDAIKSNNSYDRKDFIEDLAPEIIKKITKIQGIKNWQSFFTQIQAQFISGHISFFSNDEKIQGLIKEKNLSGEMDPGEGDFLLLVDSNIGFSKNDPLIKRSLSYKVSLKNPQNPTGEITFVHENSGKGDEPCSKLHRGGSKEDYYFPRCYWDYWRIYKNDGAQLVDSKYDPVPDDYFTDEFSWGNKIDVQPGEQGTTVIGGLSVVPQQSSKQVILSVKLPPSVLWTDENGMIHYKLRVQKEAGINSLPFKLQINPPDGYSILENQAYEIKHDDLALEIELKDPLDLEFIFQKK